MALADPWCFPGKAGSTYPERASTVPAAPALAGAVDLCSGFAAPVTPGAGGGHGAERSSPVWPAQAPLRVRGLSCCFGEAAEPGWDRTTTQRVANLRVGYADISVPAFFGRPGLLQEEMEIVKPLPGVVPVNIFP